MGSAGEFTRYAEDVGARLSEQPLQMTYTARLGAPPEEVFEFVADTDRLHEWIPGARKSWSDDTNAAHSMQVGSVRMIDAGIGKPTREIVKAYEAPRMLAYSATDASLFGLFTDHLSVVTCEPHPEGGTAFCWLAFAKPSPNPVKRWAGKKVFQVALSGGTKKLERRFPYR